MHEETDSKQPVTACSIFVKAIRVIPSVTRCKRKEINLTSRGKVMFQLNTEPWTFIKGRDVSRKERHDAHGKACPGPASMVFFHARRVSTLSTILAV